MEKDRIENQEINRDPVYYYSREHRLGRASPMVRALNEDGPVRKGAFRGLFGSRNNSLFFVAILIICLMFVMTSRFSGKEKSVKLGGNTLALAITSYDGALILDIVKNAPKRGEAYLGAVDIAVSPVMPKPNEKEVRELPPVFSHRVFFSSSASETYSISLPFEGTDFFAILRTNDEQKSIKIKAAEAK